MLEELRAEAATHGIDDLEAALAAVTESAAQATPALSDEVS